MTDSTRVVLGDHLSRFVEALIAEGRYDSASEVVRAGLGLLEARETKLKQLREAVRGGLESGPGGVFDVETFLAERERSQNEA